MMKFITSAISKEQWPDTQLEVLLVGRSNVGKSTFLNRYANQRLAYVGKTPGKTRLLNFFDLGSFQMVDAPGYGYAKRTFDEINQYQTMMEEYFEENQKLKMVIMLVDSRHKPSKEDIEMMTYLRYHHLPILVAATKIDKLKASEQKEKRLLIAETLEIPVESIWFRDLSREKEIQFLREEIERKVLSFR